MINQLFHDEKQVLKMLYRHVLCKPLVRLSLAVIVMSLLISGCTQSPTAQIAPTPTMVLAHTPTIQVPPTTQIVPTPTKDLAPTATIQITPTELAIPCGVGLLDHNVRLWAEGEYAQDLCSRLVNSIRQGGDQPTVWNGQLSAADASSYEAVCSDRFSNLSYEVVDTGGHSYGRSWCRGIVSTYGTSGLVTDPDLFNIVHPAQQSQNATLNAPLTAIPATAAAQQSIYANACKQHNGYIDINGFGECMVDYPGAPRQEIPLNPDGTWNEDMAESIRTMCDGAMQYATAAAQDGQPMSEPPQYHPDTGVCVQGNP